MRTEWIEKAEIILIGTIVFVQLLVFIRTCRQIRIFKAIIPDRDSITLTGQTPASQFAEQAPAPQITVTEEGTLTGIFEKILLAINTYLTRNRGGAANFELIKDIVERNLGAVEDDIQATISIPVYLGLMGTMLGIVLGLFNMSNLSGAINDSLTRVQPGGNISVQLGGSISVLLSGVKIAMISSFMGLALTMINSGWIFKGTRSRVEKKKNDFYSFIQTELMPEINESLSTTLQSLQRNLLAFNKDFSDNLSGLSAIFDHSRETMILQKELLQTLESTRIGEIATQNIKLFKAFKDSGEQLEKFGAYMVQMNSFITASYGLTVTARDVLERTENFGTIAGHLEHQFGENRKLMDFLSAHFTQLDEHKNYIERSVIDTGHSLSDIFRELKEHIGQTSFQVKKFTIDEMDVLRTTLSASGTNLGNLSYLEDLHTDLAEFKQNVAAQSQSLRGELQTQTAILLKLEQRDEQRMEQRDARPRAARRGLLASIKNLFTRHRQKNAQEAQ